MRWGRLPKVGRAPGSAADVVVRGLTVLVLAWEALWVVSDQRLWPMSAPHIWGRAAVWVAIMSWVLLLAALASGRRNLMSRASWLNVVVVLLCAFARTYDASTSGEGLSGDGAFFVIAAGAAGFLLSTRYAAACTAVAVGGETAFVLAVALPGGVGRSDWLYVLFPLFALTAGTAAIGARRVLLQAAQGADDADRASRRAEIAREEAEFVERELRDKERLLHEVVLNTLVAIGRGVNEGAENRARVVARCVESVAVLRDLVQVVAAPDLRRSRRTASARLASVVADAEAAGMVVSVDVSVLDTLAPATRTALVAAISEAIVNATRHSRAQNLVVRAVRTRTGDVRVVITDDGRGFTLTDQPRGFGLTRVVEDGMRSIDGHASVISSPGNGVIVELTWHDEPSTVSRFDPSGFVLPVIVAFGAYCTVAFALTWPLLARPWVALAAVVLLLGIDVLLIKVTRRGPLSWSWTLLACLGGSAVYLLQNASTAGLAIGPRSDWGSAAMISIFLVVAASGPRWSFFAVVGTWVVVQGDYVHELLSAGTAILVAGALFGRSMRRMAVQLDRSRMRLRAAETAELAADTAAARLQERYAAMDPQPVIGLLEGIAEGVVEASGPDTMVRAAREERYLRTIMRVDPGLSPIHELAAHWATICHSREVDFTVSLPEDLARAVGPVPVEVAGWEHVVDRLEPSTTSRLTLQREDGSVVIRLVVQSDGGIRDMGITTRTIDLAGIEPGGVYLDPDHGEFTSMMWEARVHVVDIEDRAGAVRS